MRTTFLCRGLVCLSLTYGCLLAPEGSQIAVGQDDLTAIDEEIARQQQIVERFLTVLERNPRRGTALDRIYGFHIENGTIEQFVSTLHERTKQQPDDGTGWMILGLIEAQRGRDAAAVEAFTKAQELRAADAMAAYYLGQSLVLIGQPENAAEAFEEAISRKPPQTDLLEIFQALGRVHQRAQRTDEALAVWSRLEKLFPGDPRVQEQIAITLVEEGQHAAALPRFESLATTTTDDYRRTLYQIEAAELKVKLNRSSDGIADLEQLLATLNPDSWLFREVRRKIEEVFLRTDDQDGLAKYYAGWLKRNPEDVDAMARLARVLARQARVPEAKEWLDKALKLAPSRKELRLAFIDQLVDDQRYAEAIEQYVELDKVDPNNPDYLRNWGKLILRDTSRPKAERETAAAEVWQRLVTARPTDPLIATQVADLFRHAQMEERALALYEKAVELAPVSPQYREYLGEYYHILKRPDEALSTWREIAAGPLRNAENLARLAEVFAQFGYIEQALPEIAAACELTPRDFSLQLKAAELQIRGEQYEVALLSLGRAESLAQNDEEREAVLAQQIKTYQLQDRLVALATELDKLAAADSATPKQWFLLARYREALREWPEATRAANEALQRQPNDIPSLAAAARIAEQSGDLKTSADFNRKLAVVDRRGRSDYLQHVAQLESQLGRTEEALAAGRDLIAAAPGNVETYQFFADLCFRLGRPDDGLAALRRATRVNPNDPNILLALAAALAGQFRTDEAIELYWQAFEKGQEIEDKLSVVGKLAELYLQTNHFDQLLERLERGRREADQRREMTICLAQAYHSAGDYGMARQELERLLSENARDTQLLQQLSKLAESEADLVSAAKYQEQLVQLAPGPETEFRLATLLSRAGDTQEACAIFVRLALLEEDQEKLLRNIDGLLSSNQFETVLAVTEPKLRENPADWELLYREGVALAESSQPVEARQRFEAILAVDAPDDELSTAAKNRQKSQGARPAGAVTTRGDLGLSRLDYSYQVRRALGIDSDYYSYSASSRTAVWTPQAFCNARLAALGWLYKLAMDEKQSDAFIASRREQARAESATNRELWDWVYLQSVVGDQQDLLPVAKRLAEQGGVPEQYLYLQQLASRRGQQVQQQSGGAAKDNTPPLPPEELELAIRCFESLRKALQPNAYAYVQSAANTILTELRRAGRTDEERALYREAIDEATTPEELYTALQLAQNRDDAEAFVALFERLAAKDLQNTDTQSATVGRPSAMAASLLGRFIARPGATPDETLKALDRFLAYHAAKTNQRRSSPTYRPPTRSVSQRTSNYIYYWVGNSQRGMNVTFPPPGEYFDRESLSLLRTAFELFRQKDLTSDLVTHLEAKVEAASAIEKLYALLALAYVQVWNEDRESAATHLKLAADLVPRDLSLRLEVANLYSEMQQLDEALAIVDAIAPLDQRVLQDRETMALDLAVRLGDHERARQAAQRLFGLRLDAETQVQLAGQMRRLGMNEEAEAVMARAQRQAGSRLAALSALMTQYQSEGRMDVAAQVAFQILRRSRTAPAMQAAMGYSTADSNYRSSALACLAQAGKLKELIAGLEEQLERSPGATQLVETLSEFYQVAGDTEKSLELKAKLVELSPDDGSLRYAYAQELYRRGRHDLACEEFKFAIRKEPRLLANRYYEVIRAFQQAKKEIELAEVMSEIDLKAMRQPYYVSELVANMLANEETRPAGLKLFEKAWESFPAQRSQLMGNFYREEIWNLPEVLDYAQRGLLPTEEAVRNDPWYGVYSGSISYNSDGKVSTVLTRVLDGAAKANRLDELQAEISAAVEKYPDWLAGPPILVVIEARRKQPLDAQMAVQALIDAEGNDYRLVYTRWFIAQELEAFPEHRELAIQLYERAIASGNDTQRQFQYSPGRRLVELYKELGRKDEARKLLETVREDKSWREQNDVYYVGQRGETLLNIATHFQQLDDPASALKTYRELLTDSSFSDPNLSRYIGGSANRLSQQAQQGLQAILKQFGEKPSPELAVALLAPVENANSSAPAIDLMLAASPAGAEGLPTLDSPLVPLLRPKGLSAEGLALIESEITTLAERHANDFSVAIASALFHLRGNDPAKASAALDRLAELVKAAPLEDLPGRQRANSRQRAAAAQQVPLWLVARECLKDSDKRELGERLAERTVSAAQRQLEPAELTAILFERGKLALESGDRGEAERWWNELIDLAIVQPRIPRAPSVAAAADRTGPTPPRATAIPATVSQFKLAAAIAEAAARHDLFAVSLSAMREGLSGGLPVPDLAPPSSTPSRIISVASTAGVTGRGGIDQAVFNELATRMWQLSRAWQEHNFPPAEVCQLLEGLVFPTARPGNILLYEQSVVHDLASPRSVGRLLVEWAVAADRVDALQQQIAARRATPTDVVSGQVLLVQLHAIRGERDEAARNLQALDKALETSKLAALVNLAAHAAAAALDDDRLKADALPLVERLLADASSQTTSSASPSTHSPITIVTREHLRLGNGEGAREQIERYLQSRQSFYGRYSGDYGQYIQRTDLAWAATELARGGDLETTLFALARFADVPPLRDRDAPIAAAVWHLARQVRQLPADRRYELLRDWTMPTESRRSVRVVAGFDTGQPIPDVFLDKKDPRHERAPQFEANSNLSLLVEAAREAGKLGELSQAVDPLAAEKVPGAEPLALLALMARGESAAAAQRLEEIAKALRDIVPQTTDRTNRPPLPDLAHYLVARAALDVPELRDPARKLCELVLEQARKTNQKDLIAHLGYDLARQAMRDVPPDNRNTLLAPPLAHWLLSTGARTIEGTHPPALWSVHDGYLVHQAGCAYDALYFKYPLEGQFEFSFDTYTAYYSQSEMGYGGLICFPRFNPRQTIIWPASQHEQVTRPAQIENLSGWNRRSVQVTGNAIRFYVNGHLAYEDKSPSRTSPWLAIYGLSERNVAMKNFRLTGTPTIPRAVDLLTGDRLEGWNATYFGERMPTRLMQAEPESLSSQPATAANYITTASGQTLPLYPSDPPQLDWEIKDGVLLGRRDHSADARWQSLLFYHRPLAEGERVRYQFFYEPGRTHVHPTLGLIAFLLDPEGVKLHWMGRETGIAPLVVDWRNVVEDPACRRGLAQLPLKEGDWNDVELAVAGDTVTIVLNGELICERPIEPTSDRRFGLFRFKGQSEAKVRGMVLTGDWPEALLPEDQSHLLALATPVESRSLTRARHALIGEGLLSSDAYHVWLAAQDLAGEERYAYLKPWVLPSDSHPTLRLQVDWTPTDAPHGSPHAAREGSIAWSEMFTSIHTGGEMVAPALELIDVAQQLGKLDELEIAAALAAKELPDQARNVVAFEALLAIAREDDATAAARLKQCLEFVNEQPAETPIHERHAELLVGYAALSRPELHKDALALAEQIVNDQKRPRYVDNLWERRVRRLRAVALWHSDPATAGQSFGETEPLPHWFPANRPTAQFRGQGFSSPAWRLTPREMTYLTGNARDALYFQLPLVGNFEVRMERATNGWRELRPLYGGVAIDINHDGLSVVRQEVGRGDSTNLPRKEKPKEWGPWVEQRLVVKDGTMTTFINGEQIHTERLPADADPWLAIETKQAHNMGSVRNVEVLGTPTIPREVTLSGGADLAGWSADYYGESAGGENANWTKKDSEIVASKLQNAEGSFRESILQYHRPLFGDGELEYEFFYEPGKMEVHPTLDRMALLLTPEGVQLHWLTDAQYDRTGTAPDNAEPLADSKPVPLRSGDWNRLTLSLAGDEVVLAVNGEQVARRTLDAANQRIFGLFRYADAAAVRVRNVVLRGSWPAALPVRDP